MDEGMPRGARDGDDAVEEAWRAVILAVRAELWGAGQDANEDLYALFPARMLRGRLASAPAGREWFTWRVPDDDLARRDARERAREFLDRYRAAAARAR
jgi:hypothetical protein